MSQQQASAGPAAGRSSALPPPVGGYFPLRAWGERVREGVRTLRVSWILVDSKRGPPLPDPLLQRRRGSPRCSRGGSAEMRPSLRVNRLHLNNLGEFASEAGSASVHCHLDGARTFLSNATRNWSRNSSAQGSSSHVATVRLRASPSPQPLGRGRTLRRTATNRGVHAFLATAGGAPSPQGKGPG